MLTDVQWPLSGKCSCIKEEKRWAKQVASETKCSEIPFVYNSFPRERIHLRQNSVSNFRFLYVVQTHVHTHIHTYIYMYIKFYFRVSFVLLGTSSRAVRPGTGIWNVPEFNDEKKAKRRPRKFRVVVLRCKDISERRTCISNALCVFEAPPILQTLGKGPNAVFKVR